MTYALGPRRSSLESTKRTGERQLESSRSEATKLRLVEGERLESVLGLGVGVGDPDNVLVLTNSRLALVKRSGRQRRSNFTSVKDIETIEVAEVRPGVGGYLWAGLAVIVAALLWFTIDNVIGSAVSAAAVGAVGLFLLYDRLSEPATTRMTFNTRRSGLVCELGGERPDEEVQAFVNRVFELKDGMKSGSWALR